ncbi:uncharacterized protein LOC122274592 [Carya illinoinensis]|uniref:uncharacterized protein LOC122274592 n=1 Tax=Carya illinoinensis TaxID=32201 RepID=UPI001C7249B4|nr:uncharacterized protein LOC122274592 [Carya illinoinensis]
MDIEALISQTEALSWQDLQLKTTPEAAKSSSEKILVGRLVADRPLNKFAIHSCIKASWKFVQNFLIEDMDVNKFIFTFRTPQDKLRVLNQRPWNFKGHLMILKQWSPGATIEEVSLNEAIFNVQLDGLPLDHFNLENAVDIGKVIGKLIKVEVDPIYGLAFRKFIRIKVAIDVTIPLKKGFPLKRFGNKEVWIAFKYEKLVDFCYACGRLGHSQIFCGFPTSTLQKIRFGPALRAEYYSPQNLPSMQNTEDEAGNMESEDILPSQNNAPSAELAIGI